MTTPGMNKFEARTFRKTALNLWTSIDMMQDEDQHIIWPTISSSEMDSKRVRRPEDVEKPDCRLQQKSCLSDKISSDCVDGSAATCQHSRLNFERVIKENLSTEFEMKRSVNLCSPILKEDRGHEAWRDLL